MCGEKRNVSDTFCGLQTSVWLVLPLLWCAFARAGDLVPIQVNILPGVSATLQQADPERRKRLEKAVKVGDAFVRRYMDQRAYDLDPERYDGWAADTGLLMAMGAETFQQMSQTWWDFDIKDDRYPPQSTGKWQACPTASLVGLDVIDGKVLLTYRATKIGYVVSNQSALWAMDFVVPEDQEVHEVQLTVEPNHRISMARPSEESVPIDFRMTVQGLKSFIQEPSRWKRIGDSKKATQEAVMRKRHVIDAIGRTATQVCKSTGKNVMEKR